MDVLAAFPSKYLKAADLEDREHKLVIQRVELGDVGDDGSKKPVLYFTKAKKGLLLNKTNAKTISTAYGRDTDGWTGKEVVLFSMMVQFKDELVEGIRVKIPKAAKAPVKVEASPAEGHDEDPAAGMDDEIPF